MNLTKTSVESKESHTRFRALEEARDAVTKLHALKPLLSAEDEETLSILIDKELVGHLETSLKEAAAGKIEPLKNILE